MHINIIEIGIAPVIQRNWNWWDAEGTINPAHSELFRGFLTVAVIDLTIIETNKNMLAFIGNTMADRSATHGAEVP